MFFEVLNGCNLVEVLNDFIMFHDLYIYLYIMFHDLYIKIYVQAMTNFGCVMKRCHMIADD